MKDDLATRDGPLHPLVALDVAFDHVNITEQLTQVGSTPGCEVVEDTNLMAELKRAARRGSSR